MSERARMVDTGSGREPETPGWFVLNVKDAAWKRHEKFGAACTFEGTYRFPEIGVNVRVLQPGEPNCYYHAEDCQEDFLVLSGECLLLIDEREERLEAYDFVHVPPHTPHVFVGAGDGPCVVLMIGVRDPDTRLLYPVSELAKKHGAGVERETTSPKEAYAGLPAREPVDCPWPLDRRT